MQKGGRGGHLSHQLQAAESCGVPKRFAYTETDSPGRNAAQRQGSLIIA